MGGASNPCLFDWDSDGDLDLISGFNMGDLKYYRNTGSSTGPAWEADHSVFSAIEGESIYSSIAVGDLDNNGHPDLIIGFVNNVLVVYENSGTQFTANSSYFNNLNIGWWLIPRLIDMDWDRDLDLIVSNDAGDLHFFENQGTAASADFVIIDGYFSGISGPSNAVPAMADYDNDSDYDLLVGGISGDLEYYENTGTYSTPSWIENSALFSNVSVHQNAAPAYGDLDGDGDPDLTVGAYNGTFSYFENQNPIVSNDIESPVLPDLIRITSVFPNPFNGSVSFSIAGARTGLVRIDFYDLAGRLHHSHLENILHEGNSLVTVSMPAGTTSGVYLYQISDSDHTAKTAVSGKLVYLK